MGQRTVFTIHELAPKAPFSLRALIQVWGQEYAVVLATAGWVGNSDRFSREMGYAGSRGSAPRSLRGHGAGAPPRTSARNPAALARRRVGVNASAAVGF